MIIGKKSLVRRRRKKKMIRKILWYLGNLKHIYFMYQYKKHLKMRIEKNNFGRNEEW